MKKLLTIVLSIISVTLIAQVPQGVGYQGVATDANGIELVNQSISIRASVLSGSATGTIEWEETHATTTDTFGLFTLTIGQGTNTTNGAQSTFADISWGTNTHFLKIEMDVTGGANYSFMGTNQMMSVPYALYAESANINYDSISNLLSGDSTFITNVGSGMGGDGCDYAFPDGLYGEPVQIDLLNSNYTVPNGKNLYIISTVDFGGNAVVLTVNGLRHSIGSTPSIIKSGDEISYNWGANPSEVTIYGILIDAIIEPVQINLLNSNYTVPSGKNLYITSTVVFGGSSLDFTVNGFRYSIGLPPSIIKSGDELSYNWSANPTEATVYGYLADENYFAGCGGGGGSSATSSLDSTAIANMIAGAGGGCNFTFPEGLVGEPVYLDLLSSSYTVPSGKNLYIMSAQKVGAGNNFLNVNGFEHSEVSQGTFASNGAEMPLIVKSGDVVSSTGSPSQFVAYGILMDAIIEPVQIDLLSSSYTVPSGKNLYIMSAQKVGAGNNFLNVNGFEHSEVSQGTFASNGAEMPLIVKSGDVVSSTGSPSQFVAYGYLADENYFAGCGGGGSSTTTSSNSVGDFSYPDGKDNITPVIHDLGSSTYIVPTGKNLYITSYWGVNSTDELQISSNTVFKGRGQYSNGQGAPVGLFELPIIVASSEIVSAPGKMNGFLVNESITPITFSLSGNYVNNITYTVPAGKILVLLNFYSAMNGGYGNLQADGMFQLYGSFNYFDNISGCSPGCESTNIKNPLFFDENTIISTEGWGDLQVINGYLMEK